MFSNLANDKTIIVFHCKKTLLKRDSRREKKKLKPLKLYIEPFHPHKIKKKTVLPCFPLSHYCLSHSKCFHQVAVGPFLSYGITVCVLYIYY